MSTQKTTILLIDDEESLLDVLETAIVDAGYFCLRSSNGEAALKILDRTPEVDVIVSDIRMPAMDGIELLRTVRERFGARTWLQVIFVTGHATLEKSVEALRLDAVDFLHKPVRRLQLLEAVDKAVQKSAAQRQISTKLIEGHERLERLLDEAHKLSDVLGGVKNTHQLNDYRVETPSNSDPQVQIPLNSERLLELLRTRDIRTRYFTDRLFIDPAWHMLLDLMEHHLLERNVSVSSLYIASGVAPATASRRLEEMEDAGLVERWLDPTDKRRQFVRLTTKAIDLVTDYLVALGQKILG